MLFELSYLMVSLFWLKFTLWVLLPPKLSVKCVRRHEVISLAAVLNLLWHLSCLTVCAWRHAAEHPGIWACFHQLYSAQVGVELLAGLDQTFDVNPATCSSPAVFSAYLQRGASGWATKEWTAFEYPQYYLRSGILASSVRAVKRVVPERSRFFPISSLQLLHLSRAQTITTQGSSVPGINQRLVWWFDWIVLF